MALTSKSTSTTSNLQSFVTLTIGEYGIGQFLVTCVYILPLTTTGMMAVAISSFSYAPDWWRIKRNYNQTSVLITLSRMALPGAGDFNIGGPML